MIACKGVSVSICQEQLNGENVIAKKKKNSLKDEQFVMFKSLSYCLEETVGFDVKVSFARPPVSRLIRLYNKEVLREGYSVPRGFSVTR